MVDVNDVADFYIDLYRETEDPMTNIRINKFLYFAQAWHLAFFDEPLFSDDFQAWKRGPVIPSIYHKYKGPVEPITSVSNPEYNKMFSGDQINLLIAVAKKYERFSNQALVGITHMSGPWKDVYRENMQNITITKEAIADYFKSEKEKGNGPVPFDADLLDDDIFVGYFDSDRYTVLPRSMDD